MEGASTNIPSLLDFLFITLLSFFFFLKLETFHAIWFGSDLCADHGSSYFGSWSNVGSSHSSWAYPECLHKYEGLKIIGWASLMCVLLSEPTFPSKPRIGCMVLVFSGRLLLIWGMTAPLFWTISTFLWSIIISILKGKGYNRQERGDRKTRS